MKLYLKVYGVTVLCTFLCILFPWVMAELGVTNGIDVLQYYSLVAGLVGIVLSVIYVLRKVKTWRPRLIILLLNPAIYYIIVVICFGILISKEPWHGFNL